MRFDRTPVEALTPTGDRYRIVERARAVDGRRRLEIAETGKVWSHREIVTGPEAFDLRAAQLKAAIESGDWVPPDPELRIAAEFRARWAKSKARREWSRQHPFAATAKAIALMAGVPVVFVGLSFIGSMPDGAALARGAFWVSIWLAAWGVLGLLVRRLPRPAGCSYWRWAPGTDTCSLTPVELDAEIHKACIELEKVRQDGDRVILPGMIDQLSRTTRKLSRYPMEIRIPGRLRAVPDHQADGRLRVREVTFHDGVLSIEGDDPARLDIAIPGERAELHIAENPVAIRSQRQWQAV